MCGICGIFYPGQIPELLAADLAVMTERLRHRGPDGHGLHLENNIALGHRRLSIIDLEGGKQPMADSRGYAIVFNGEIYNFQAIRRQLESQGEVFSTTSDTEVLLKAYIAWGEACLEKLNGMFAFAVADFKNRCLFLARDRLGIKPLYYSRFPGGFAFASEINSLLACRFVRTDLDLTHFPYYLSHLFFPREHSPYLHIHRLQPGHSLRVDEKAMRLICYWDIAEKYPENGAHRVTREDEEELCMLITDAVEMQTVSDVPIGTLLSGGLDSGIVTARVASFLPYQIQSFTVGFKGIDAFDETKLAAQSAARYGTDHNELQMTADDLLSFYEVVLAQFGQPFADSSALPTYLISRFARNKVKVVLSGDGGDEQFGGYYRFMRYLQLTRYRSQLRWAFMKDFAGHLLQLSGNLTAPFHPYLARRLRRYGLLMLEETTLLYRDLIQVMSLAEMATVAGERLLPKLDEDLVNYFDSRDPELHLDGIMVQELKNYMVDDVLTKVDTMSMAVGLEVRVPLLDHRLVEKAVSLSWKDKISTKQSKVLLRRLFYRELPAEVRTAPKSGFGIPLDRWFRGPLRDLARETLLGPSCRKRGILDPNGVQTLLEAHERGTGNYGHRIWALLALEKWFLQVEGP
jgi:asparagine synthase (glutamine-hydrolysing)